MINRDTLYTNIFGSSSKEEYITLLIFGFIGLIISMLVEVIRAKSNIKSKGGFSIGFWISDNWARGLLSIITIFVGVLFNNEISDIIGVNIELGNKSALITGFMTDKIIETLVSLKLQFSTINLINKKSN